MIDLTYYNKKKTRDLWREYLKMLENENFNNDAGFQLRAKKLSELITEMAKGLGLGKEISQFDIDRVYTPLGFWEQTMKAREIQQELLRVLKNSSQIVTTAREMTPETPSVVTPKGNSEDASDE
jgi:hypothetical protein